MGPPSPHDGVPGGRTRGGRAAGMSNDEWARQRKDNHVSPGDSSTLHDVFLELSPTLPSPPSSLLLSIPSVSDITVAVVATARYRAHHLVFSSSADSDLRGY